MTNTKYTIVQTNIFKKDRKKILKQGLNISKLEDIVIKLANGETLEAKYKDHKLTGSYTRI